MRLTGALSAVGAALCATQIVSWTLHLGGATIEDCVEVECDGQQLFVETSRHH